MTPDIKLAAELEECLLHAWPSISTEFRQGWVLRRANGYSGRANSASALGPSAGMDEALLAYIIGHFQDAGLQPQVRLSPVADAKVKDFLLAHGFVVKNRAHTMGLSLDACSPHDDARFQLSRLADDRWLNGISMRQEPSKRSPGHLKAIVSRIQVPARFATGTIDGEAVAFGVAAVVRGWAELGSIMVDEAHRGRGFGRGLMNTLLRWAKQEGADHAFLQVDVKNSVAISLYASLGFRVLYDYETLALTA